MAGVSLSPIYNSIQDAIDALEAGISTPEIVHAIRNLKEASGKVRTACPRVFFLPVTTTAEENARDERRVSQQASL